MSFNNYFVTDNLEVWTSSIKTKVFSGRGRAKNSEQYGVKRLREIILELAIRGLLVPQEKSDEPAEKLLERIKAEKDRLLNEGNSKKNKNLQKIEDEMPFEIPNSWTWTQLGVISEIGPRNELEDDLEVGFVPMPLITSSYQGSHEQEIREWVRVKKGYTHFANGDIAIAKITPCFENSKAVIFSNLTNGYGAGTTELHVARLIGNQMNSRYILLYLKSLTFLEKGKQRMTGSAGQKRVPASFFASNPLPLPPKEEQSRIIMKVDELMTLCDQLEKDIDKSIESQSTLVNTLLSAITSKTNNPTQFGQSWGIIQSNFDNLFTTEKSIDQLKQTIVKLSIMGKLTFQDPKDEHPSELIKLITKEIANFSKVDELNKQISQSSIKKEAQTYPLPIGWISVRFGDIFTLKYGNNLPSEKRSETGEFPVFGSNGIVGTHNESCIDKPCIIVGRKGSAGALNLCLKNGCWVTDVAYSLVPPSSVNLEYVYLCLQSLDLNSLSKGIKPGLNRKEVYDLIISIPPLKEQQRIVTKVDQIMKVCEQLKKSIISAETKKINFVDSVMEKTCS